MSFLCEWISATKDVANIITVVTGIIVVFTVMIIIDIEWGIRLIAQNPVDEVVRVYGDFCHHIP